jgi:sensor domain CHASE-containing protein
MSRTANAAARSVRPPRLGGGAPQAAREAQIAHDQDLVFERNSATLVSSGLEGKARMMGAVGLDYANWDDAFDNISVTWNQEWIDNSFYSSVADGLFLFRQNGAVRYSWVNEAHSENGEELARVAAQAAARLPHLKIRLSTRLRVSAMTSS